MERSDLRLQIAIAGEDEAHRILATSLIDQVILEHARLLASPWPERDQLDQARVWRGLTTDRAFYDHKTVDDDLRAALNIPAGQPFFRTQRIDGEPAKGAGFFCDLISLFALCDPPVEVLVVMKDTDGKRSLFQDADRAKRWLEDTDDPSLDAVVLGIAHRDAEGWFVAGLVQDATTRQRRTLCQRELSFDPCWHPDRLTAQPNDARTDAKRVLRFLLGEGSALDTVRSRSVPATDLPALAERTLSDLTALREVGEHAGLTAFLDDVQREVAQRLLPGQ